MSLPNKIFPIDTGTKLAAVRISKIKVWISWKMQNNITNKNIGVQSLSKINLFTP